MLYYIKYALYTHNLLHNIIATFHNLVNMGESMV